MIGLEVQKIFADCSDRNLTEIPSLIGKYNNWITEVNLSGNQIEFLPSLKNDSFKNIRVLNLSNNPILSITTDSLQVLKLNDNEISLIDYSIIKNLKKLNISLIT